LVLLIAAIATDLFTAIHHPKESWDDAVITASFSRTWAQTGNIAITPTSATVEGYSSVLWFLLLSVPAFLTRRAEPILIWMKVLSAIFSVASLGLLYTVARAQFRQWWAPAASVLLVAFSAATYRETRNGMEMNLDAFLLLLLFYILTRERLRARIAWATLTSFLLLLTRFEAPFQLALLAIGMILAARDRSMHVDDMSRSGPIKTLPAGATVSEVLWIGALSAAGFLLISIWRHHTFGLWMPNTVYAKQHPPYNSEFSFLGTRWRACIEPLRVFPFTIAAAILAAAVASFSGRTLPAQLRGLHPAAWTLAFGSFCFGAIFGLNWGYPGRMVLPMLPFLVLVAVGICLGAIKSRRLSSAILGCSLVLQGLFWVRTVRLRPLGITTRAVEPEGVGADRIRLALHKEHLVALIPDIGGSSLCCESLTIVDAAFLADPTLSHTGWEGFPEYFRKVNPELVEAQFGWAAHSGLYTLGLLDNYSIVASDGVRFFVRNDLYNQLIAQHAGPVLPVASVPGCMPPRQADDNFSLSKGTCLVLNDMVVQNNPF
jgi:hypothetical protein